jgi:hypothetical protein
LRAVFAAVVLAFGLHAVVIVAIRAGGLETGRSPSTGSLDEAWVQARVVYAAQPPLNGQAFVQKMSSAPASRSASKFARPTDQVEDGNSTRSASGGVHYFESGDLDQVAVPVGEWTIDTSLLPLTGECTFQVSIWVSARGEIEKWEAKSSMLDEDVTTGIFARLNETVMNPALIGVKPMASVLRFELSVERQ